MNGKGSKPRPYNPAAFAAGWNRVFGRKHSESLERAFAKLPLTPPAPFYRVRRLSDRASVVEIVTEEAQGDCGATS